MTLVPVGLQCRLKKWKRLLGLAGTHRQHAQVVICLRMIRLPLKDRPIKSFRVLKSAGLLGLDSLKQCLIDRQIH